MSRLQLDPASIVERVRASGSTAHIPTLKESLLRGMLGFTFVSVAGFAPWAVGGSWFKAHGGILAMFLACAVIFIVLSGLLLHRLIIGPGSLGRFYAVFGLGFILYSAAWIPSYIYIRGHLGGVIGLGSGLALMSLVFTFAFDSLNNFVKVFLSLFLLNALGYFGGGIVVLGIIGYENTLTMLLWGICYGLGFGAGLGLAFYFCQEHHREMLKSSTS